MTDANHEPSGKERLQQAYERMMQRVHAVIEEAEEQILPPLKRNIAHARDQAVELGELTREEAEKIAAYLHRDLDDAGHYLAGSGKELSDWLRFDLKAIEDHLLELIVSVADKTRLEWLELEQDLRDGPSYHAGEITGPGTLVCVACGAAVSFHSTDHITPCTGCQGTVFRRTAAHTPSDN